MNTQPNQSISINNAGLILLNAYIPLLFKRLGLMNGNIFIDEKSHSDSVFYLQYVSTGTINHEEESFPLYKILCGLPSDYPLQNQIVVSGDQKQLMDGMIEAAIAHWPGMGNTTIDGFRGSWLIRNGALTEFEDKWQLQVEKRGYDILLQKLPFSFTFIKFSWMNKPLLVQWPY